MAKEKETKMISEAKVIGTEKRIVNGKEIEVQKIALPQSPYEYIDISIHGTAPLILNGFTETAQKEIEENQTTEKTTTKKATEKQKKPPINPYQRLIESLHWIDMSDKAKADGRCPSELTEDAWKTAMDLGLNGNSNIGYDASGIKKGICDAVVRVMGETKSTIHNANIQVIPVSKNLIPIQYGSYEAERSIISQFKGTFLTYRNVFDNWSMKIRFAYNPVNISAPELIDLVGAMGFSGGLGAHRVGLKGGTNGTFVIDGAEMTTELVRAEKLAKEVEQNVA